MREYEDEGKYETNGVGYFVFYVIIAAVVLTALFVGTNYENKQKAQNVKQMKEITAKITNINSAENTADAEFSSETKSVVEVSDTGRAYLQIHEYKTIGKPQIKGNTVIFKVKLPQ